MRSATPAAARLAWNRWLSCSASSTNPSISWGPRSLPAWGSMVVMRTPDGAALASTMALRPWKLPISTTCWPADRRLAASHSRPAWARVIQPCTSATAATVPAKVRGVPAASPESCRSGVSAVSEVSLMPPGAYRVTTV